MLCSCEHLMLRRVLRLAIQSNGILKATTSFCQHSLLGGMKQHSDAAGVSLYGDMCLPIIPASLGTEPCFPHVQIMQLACLCETELQHSKQRVRGQVQLVQPTFILTRNSSYADGSCHNQKWKLLSLCWSMCPRCHRHIFWKNSFTRISLLES